MTTQPEFSFWFKDVGFSVENYGTDPDIEVEILPLDHAVGKDPQLTRAIKEVTKLLEKNPPMVPDISKRPSLIVKRLPARTVSITPAQITVARTSRPCFP